MQISKVLTLAPERILAISFRFVSFRVLRHSMAFHRTFVGNNIWRNRDTEERRRQLFIVCSKSLKTESKMDETWNVKLLSVEIGLRVGMSWTGKSGYILHFLFFLSVLFVICVDSAISSPRVLSKNRFETFLFEKVIIAKIYFCLFFRILD